METILSRKLLRDANVEKGFSPGSHGSDICASLSFYSISTRHCLQQNELASRFIMLSSTLDDEIGNREDQTIAHYVAFTRSPKG